MELDPTHICFGLDEELDRSSCATYLQLLGRKELAETLASRLSSREIEELVNLTAGLMHTHLSKNEYHRLFLLSTHDHGSQDIS